MGRAALEECARLWQARMTSSEPLTFQLAVDSALAMCSACAAAADCGGGGGGGGSGAAAAGPTAFAAACPAMAPVAVVCDAGGNGCVAA